jgi:hypothetical protein
LPQRLLHTAGVIVAGTWAMLVFGLGAAAFGLGGALGLSVAALLGAWLAIGFTCSGGWRSGGRRKSGSGLYTGLARPPALPAVWAHSL